ncbi:protein rep [Microcystis wesenbergii]|uniref:protein rep n=2 Tax=Microcystis TaxID=1125 RepID=UPI0016818B29|nr:protein rep [Microcystis wesenbergii]MBD2119155.1 protein rep [Microcystis wesenbergii FACHB-1339]
MNNIPLTDGDASFYLSDLSPKDKSWDAHKDESREVSSIYTQAQNEKYAERIHHCSQSLEFRILIDDKQQTHLKLHSARFCRVRLCPVCQWRRSMMWRARFLKALPKICADYPRGRFIFLTLTVRNCPLEDLRETIAWMNSSWKKMTMRKNFPALGWIKCIEVTRSEDDMAHPHFHCLLMVNQTYFSRGYISQSDWTKMWKECLKVDYTPIVNIKRVKEHKQKRKQIVDSVNDSNVNNCDNTTVDTSVDDIIAGVLETIKYSVKPDDLIGTKTAKTSPQDWLAELTRQLHKTRSIALGGIFKEYLSEDEPEDLINADIEEETDLDEEEYNYIFEWREVTKRYAYKESVNNK